MGRSGRAIVAYVLSLAAIGGASLWQQRTVAAHPEGPALYQQSCSGCHGQEGEGSGLEAKLIGVRAPALGGDEALRGRGATDREVVENAIARGVPGTWMPSHRRMNARRRGLLVDHLQGMGRGPRARQRGAEGAR